MKDIHINKTEQIEALQIERNRLGFTSYGFSSAIIIFIIIIIIILLIKGRNKKSIEIHNLTNTKQSKSTDLQNSEDNTISKESTKHQIQNSASETSVVTKTALPTPSRRKFYETPFF